MTVTVFPSRPTGTVAAPPSKSMAHRLLICAGLTDGVTAVRGAAPSEGILATADCLRALGAACDFGDDGVTVTGGGLCRPAGGAILPCRESGSTLRFFLPLCLTGQPVTLTGSPRLLARPMDVYETLCRERGIRFEAGEDAVRVEGTLEPGLFTVPGDISSQFVSGLLFALPRLSGDSGIRLIPPVESRSYIGISLDALRRFGVRAEWTDEYTLAVPGGQSFGLPSGTSEVRVEGDWSNAAFFLALGVPVTGLDPDSRQGDRVCVPLMEAIRAGGAEADLTDCPDLAPVLMAYAAMHGGAVFTGTRRLSMKESDRGRAMEAELAKCGVRVRVDEDRITVGSGLRAPTEVLDGHNDHRIVMALAVLCTRTGGTIRGAEAVRKSYPDFWEIFQEAGAEVRTDGMDQ
jgi:3-phosphoshikimate 1-carboxyvinyltransferase